jgi:RNA polymerase sigma factor (sigma-70 family)
MTEPFRDLVQRYQDTVCAVAYSVLGDRARSEEVAQEAFLVAWLKLPAMSPPPPMPGWLCGITRNLARNAARKRRETPMETREPAAATTPLGELLDAETERLANRALAELPESYRDVVVLHYRGDHSVAQIAVALGISEANAKQRLHRGRERLRTALAAVETTLRATRPGPAFTAACVAALAAGGASAEAAAIAMKSGTSTATMVAIPVAAALLLGGGGWAVVENVRSEDKPSSAASAGVATAAAPVGPATPAPAPATGIRRLDPQARAQLVARITEARHRREQAVAPAATAPAAASAAPALPALPTTLSKDDIRLGIRAVLPFLAECYDEAAPRLPKRDGQLVVKMMLKGEPDVGTVIDAHTIEGDDFLVADAELTACWRESLMSIEMPPLAAGGEVEYPFRVSPDH